MKRRTTSTTAGIRKRTAGFQAITEPGNINGVVTKRSPTIETTAKDVKETNLYSFISFSPTCLCLTRLLSVYSIIIETFYFWNSPKPKTAQTDLPRLIKKNLFLSVLGKKFLCHTITQIHFERSCLLGLQRNRKRESGQVTLSLNLLFLLEYRTGARSIRHFDLTHH